LLYTLSQDNPAHTIFQHISNDERSLMGTRVRW